MTLPTAVKTKVEKKLDSYCEKKIPDKAKDKIRLITRFRGNSVTLVESRPYHRDPAVWTKTVVAQFRFNPTDDIWTLYCADRNGRWHLYEYTEPSMNLDDLLKEIDDDPTGIFWG
jgi:hypothetical protein